MSLTTDPNDPRLKNIEPSGMQEVYLVLSEEERAKGFVRPYRDRYKHVGVHPTYKIRKLSAKEKEKFKAVGYEYYEKYPKSSSIIGRYWTSKQLNSGCGAETTMGRALSETYARNPKFYGATFCANCGTHFPVAEFTWSADGKVVGS